MDGWTYFREYGSALREVEGFASPQGSVAEWQGAFAVLCELFNTQCCANDTIQILDGMCRFVAIVHQSYAFEGSVQRSTRVCDAIQLQQGLCWQRFIEHVRR